MLAVRAEPRGALVAGDQRESQRVRVEVDAAGHVGDRERHGADAQRGVDRARCRLDGYGLRSHL